MPLVITQPEATGPSLKSICDLYRSVINDDFSGTGQINTDAASWMVPFLNSAIEDVYQELGLIGDMRLIKDNVIIGGIPPLQSADPAMQLGITYTGTYVGDGGLYYEQPALPADLLYIRKVWQRPTDSGIEFKPMMVAPAGLISRNQGSWFGEYELRGNNEIWTNGALLTMDMRLRYDAAWIEIADNTYDFATTFVPLNGSRNAIAQKMIANYAQRLAPEQFELADSRAEKFMKKLKSKSVLSSQTKQFFEEPFLSDGTCF